MIKNSIIYLSSVLLLGFVILSFKKNALFKPHEKLSDYGLFLGDLKNHIPANGVIPYDLNTPLFSDYAHKIRFVKIPDGTTANYSANEAFDFPEGTILSKTFYYPEDFRKPDKNKRILETRILYKQIDGWATFPYIWNTDQTEAYYDVAGKIEAVSWIDLSGKKQNINYVIPNKNQCKQCHELNGKIVPIGPTARSLNKEFIYADGTKNQLEYWTEKNKLTGCEIIQTQKLAVWNNPSTGTIHERARAYLDVNCGHCHRAGGQASTSGLFLNIHETDSVKLGIFKTPVAAGRASANMLYSIDPGFPEKSIMIYRLHSLDPGIMMPEMGRRTIDTEGLQLLKDWIKAMK
jgi:uncharacterized repeat protein (TIGR03806 family)